MAFITDTTTCPLCNEQLDRPSLATSGCAFPQGHRLWQFCDAPMHIDCLQDWPDRVEFCSAYYRQRLDQYTRERWPILATGDGWFLGMALPYPGTVYADLDEDIVEIRVEDWPISFQADAHEWSEFMAGEWQSSAEHLHSYALARAQVVIAQVRHAVPDTNALYRLITSGRKA
jgi:hypothetical protein